MRIIDLINAKKKPFVSFEFFPPRERKRWPEFFEAVKRLSSVHPLFVSVTYGASGSSRDATLELVTRLKEDFGLEAMAHLTCIGASSDKLHAFLAELQKAGVHNVLALRGDPPEGAACFMPDNTDFTCAGDLVKFIRLHFPEFGIGVAAYPEVHPDAPSSDEDLRFLKQKLDEGADFAITQLFFDNTLYIDFERRARAIGITKPIIPGILPVFSMGSLNRLVSLCGASIPADYLDSLRRADEKGSAAAVRACGAEYAFNQARNLLAQGAPGIHLYTLNKAETCLHIVKELGITPP